MTTITITLPEELAEKAKERGLFAPKVFEAIVQEKLREDEKTNFMSREEIDRRLAGLVNPETYRKGKINGDIIGPFHEEWGEAK